MANDHTVPLLIVLSGPSGVGKDAVLQRMRELGKPFHYTVTATTRPIRSGEIDGVDYVFVDREQFQSMIVDKQLLEYAEVYGNWYGVPSEPVKDALGKGKDVILKIDVQGAENIRKKTTEAVYVFLAPPSLQELERRLRERMTDSEEALTRRLKTASAEMQDARKFDHVVVNRNERIDDAVADIMEIVEQEQSKKQRTGVRL